MNTPCSTAPKKKIRAGAFHLTQIVDYGLFFLTSLAKAGESRSIRSISADYHLSFAFLQKVANRLKRAGLVKAGRGKNGGYSLAKTPSKITMKEVIEALENPIAVMDCLLEPAVRARKCPREQFCSVRAGLKSMNDQIRTFMLSKTLDEFLPQHAGSSNRTTLDTSEMSDRMPVHAL